MLEVRVSTATTPGTLAACALAPRCAAALPAAALRALPAAPASLAAAIGTVLNTEEADHAPDEALIAAAVRAIDEALIERCPHPGCGAAHTGDFDGCAAVYCPACMGFFCGLCGAVAVGSAAAHAHVQHACARNPTRGSVFVPAALLSPIAKARRVDRIHRVVPPLPLECASAVVQRCAARIGVAELIAVLGVCTPAPGDAAGRALLTVAPALGSQAELRMLGVASGGARAEVRAALRMALAGRWRNLAFPLLCHAAQALAADTAWAAWAAASIVEHLAGHVRTDAGLPVHELVMTDAVLARWLGVHAALGAAGELGLGMLRILRAAPRLRWHEAALRCAAHAAVAVRARWPGGSVDGALCAADVAWLAAAAADHEPAARPLAALAVCELAALMWTRGLHSDTARRLLAILVGWNAAAPDPAFVHAVARFEAAMHAHDLGGTGGGAP